MRRGGRVVDGSGLENRRTRKGTGGSNPSLSARLVQSMAYLGIYLTPPSPTCSVRTCDRGLSKDFAGVGATLQLRRGLCEVPCISALARRMGVPAVRRTGVLVGPASSLALRQVPIRDVGHRRHHLPGQPSATDDLVPGRVVRHQPEEWHPCFGTTACFRLGQLQDRLGDAAQIASGDGSTGSRSITGRR